MLESVKDKIKTSYKAKRNLSKVNLCLILSTAYLGRVPKITRNSNQKKTETLRSCLPQQTRHTPSVFGCMTEAIALARETKMPMKIILHPFSVFLHCSPVPLDQLNNLWNRFSFYIRSKTVNSVFLNEYRHIYITVYNARSIHYPQH